MKFTIEFIVDPDEKTYGMWVTCSTNPTKILEAAWSADDDVDPPQADYPKGWTVQPYSHEDPEKYSLSSGDLSKNSSGKLSIRRF